MAISSGCERPRCSFKCCETTRGVERAGTGSSIADSCGESCLAHRSGFASLGESGDVTGCKFDGNGQNEGGCLTLEGMFDHVGEIESEIIRTHFTKCDAVFEHAIWSYSLDGVKLDRCMLANASKNSRVFYLHGRSIHLCSTPVKRKPRENHLKPSPTRVSRPTCSENG